MKKTCTVSHYLCKQNQMFNLNWSGYERDCKVGMAYTHRNHWTGLLVLCDYRGMACCLSSRDVAEA